MIAVGVSSIIGSIHSRLLLIGVHACVLAAVSPCRTCLAEGNAPKAQAGPPVEEVRSPLSVQVVASKEAFSPLETAEVMIFVRDVDGSRVPIMTYDNPYTTLQLEVVDRHGRAIPLTRYGKHCRSVYSNPRLVDSGEDSLRLRQKLALNRVCDLSMGGEYIVRCSVVYSTGKPDDVGPKVATSEPIKIRVE